MLERRGEQSGKADDKTLEAIFTQHLDRIEHWLATQQHMTVLCVNYQETIADPAETATRGWRNFSICPLPLMQWPVPLIHACTGSEYRKIKRPFPPPTAPRASRAPAPAGRG